MLFTATGLLSLAERYDWSTQPGGEVPLVYSAEKRGPFGLLTPDGRHYLSTQPDQGVQNSPGARRMCQCWSTLGTRPRRGRHGLDRGGRTREGRRPGWGRGERR